MARAFNIRSCSTSELHVSPVVKLDCVHRRIQAGYFVDWQKRIHLNCTWSCIAYTYGRVSTEGDATTSVCVGTLTFSKFSAAWRRFLCWRIMTSLRNQAAQCAGKSGYGLKFFHHIPNPFRASNLLSSSISGSLLNAVTSHSLTFTSYLNYCNCSLFLNKYIELVCRSLER